MPQSISKEYKEVLWTAMPSVLWCIFNRKVATLINWKQKRSQNVSTQITITEKGNKRGKSTKLSRTMHIAVPGTGLPALSNGLHFLKQFIRNLPIFLFSRPETFSSLRSPFHVIISCSKLGTCAASRRLAHFLNKIAYYDFLEQIGQPWRRSGRSVGR